MRFSMLIAGILTMLVLAMPVHSTDDWQRNPHNLVGGLAGAIFDRDGKAYLLKATEPGNVKVIHDRINGEWVRPQGYFIEQGFVCKFYQESTRGIGSLIGSYQGRVLQSFGDNDWAVFYECYATVEGSTNTSAVPTNVHAQGKRMIPCGSVQTADGGRLSLNEGYEGQMFNFAVNGEPYTPVGYHVSNGCECRFYRTVRGGAEMITASAGPSDGQFGDTVATRYQCWIKV